MSTQTDPSQDELAAMPAYRLALGVALLGLVGAAAALMFA
jgi:hypothetical protein